MTNQDKQNNDDYQPPVDTPYKKPWFIAIGVLAVLGLVGSLVLWLW